MSIDKDDPHQEAEEVREERIRAAQSEEERQKIRKQPVEPLLKEPGSPKEWD
ncbi:hypothetical protein [Falsirhodobacter deserti]|uniref:hypothetical protein n=1 Tax=Falsirhodobacter deserti TaxID=1365611 RepID=UPI0013E3D011|nr:hypothetical protein [Falsirhodobacter deserti]